MSLQTAPVTIEKELRIRDDAGGKTPSWHHVGTYLATRNRKAKVSDFRQEQAAHKAAGPGVETRTEEFFAFRVPFPALPPVVKGVPQVYRIVEADGTVWKVQFLRKYDWTLQVDVEVFA